ncbi:microtubule associated protein SPM2 [Cardiosporidium cionae]|uniref:Microtubule associated protein SPM2 n=1 Tax=Cardiosporidium cionae TaxID=476202 RepID=A0ABQ7J565_9APIC|nr:microtubule associated protein SPM2 [Cardiosporidium cionae]|eukprot:KAF8817926.1 microtubule associated protein SPM2 [Cardiosporidium cionae]
MKSAGMPSKRLSEVYGDSVFHRKGLPMNSETTAMQDNVSELLRNFNSENGLTAAKFPTNGYAGIPSLQLNKQMLYGHSARQLTTNVTNSSRNIATLWGEKATVDSRDAEIFPAQHQSRKNLKQYFPASNINEAFCTRCQIINSHTGRTEIMAARRPGKATAEVNIVEFDAYQHRRQRQPILTFTETGIKTSKMGMTTRKGRATEKKRLTTLTPLSYSMRSDQLCCTDFWMVPKVGAQVQNNLGQSKRQYELPLWNDKSARPAI